MHSLALSASIQTSPLFQSTRTSDQLLFPVASDDHSIPKTQSIVADPSPTHESCLDAGKENDHSTILQIVSFDSVSSNDRSVLKTRGRPKQSQPTATCSFVPCGSDRKVDRLAPRSPAGSDRGPRATMQKSLPLNTNGSSESIVRSAISGPPIHEPLSEHLVDCDSRDSQNKAPWSQQPTTNNQRK